jgi:hypothetical protein
MPDCNNWTAPMVLNWVLTRDMPAVLTMADMYGADIVPDDGIPRRAVPEDLDAVTRTYCIDPTLPLKQRVLRSQKVIAAKAEIYRALHRGELEARARRNGSGDVETIAPMQWPALKFQSSNGYNLAVPIAIDQDVLDLPQPIEDYLRGRVPANARPVAWPDPLFMAVEVVKLWPAGGATRLTAGAEAETKSWLISLMHFAPTQAKRQYEAEARKRFRVGIRAFNRAWSDAVKATGNTRWSSPGRKSQQCIDTPAKS